MTGSLYCIVLYLLPVLNPKSYDGARVLEASGRPMLVIGRSYWVVPIQQGDEKTGTKLAEEITEGITGITGGITGTGTGAGTAGTKTKAESGGHIAATQVG